MPAAAGLGGMPGGRANGSVKKKSEVSGPVTRGTATSVPRPAHRKWANPEIRTDGVEGDWRTTPQPQRVQVCGSKRAHDSRARLRRSSIPCMPSPRAARAERQGKAASSGARHVHGIRPAAAAQHNDSVGGPASDQLVYDRSRRTVGWPCRHGGGWSRTCH